MPLFIETEILISAPTARVWAVLLDFERHAEWNPFVRAIVGEARPGARLSLAVQPPGGRIMRFRPRVLRVEANRELRWLGQLLFPGLLDGEHYFCLEDLDDAGTRLVHGERFSGVLLALLRASLAEPTRKGFEAMNQALKARVEQKEALTCPI